MRCAAVRVSACVEVGVCAVSERGDVCARSGGDASSTRQTNASLSHQRRKGDAGLLLRLRLRLLLRSKLLPALELRVLCFCLCVLGERRRQRGGSLPFTHKVGSCSVPQLGAGRAGLQDGSDTHTHEPYLLLVLGLELYARRPALQHRGASTSASPVAGACCTGSACKVQAGNGSSNNAS